jgi:hypothetical protein
MAVTNPTHRDIKKTQVYMEQMSWDDTFEVLTRLALTMNPVTNALERKTAIQGNASLAFTWNSDGTLATMTKTVGAASYRKTFTWTDGNLTGITTWSAV